jgi:hypothetical protein
MKIKRKIKVVLKKAAPVLETHPSLGYKWDPKQTNEMHPHHQVRARENDTLSVLRMQMHHLIEEVMKDGTIGELNATVYIMQCMVHTLYYGRELKREHDKRKKVTS